MKHPITYGIFLSTLFLNACTGSKTPNTSTAMPAISVSSFTVAEANIKSEKNYPGRVVALNETELRTEVSGYITKILVSDGANVSKGQAMYEIDRQRYSDAYQQATSNLSVVKSNMEKANRDLARYEALKKQDAIAQQIVDNAYTDVNTAKAQLIAAQAQVSSAALNLSRAVVKAPFGGTIGISQVRMGALVSAGSTLLNTLSATNPMAIEIAADEQSIPLLNQLKSNKTDSLFTLQLSDGSVYAQTGHLSVIDRAVNPETGTINVRINFPNPNGELKAGMSGTLRIKTHDDGQKIAIPYKAVVEQLSDYYVYVINDKKIVNQRLVKLGAQYQGSVVILEGLKVGEKIVVDGLQNPMLREGSSISLETVK